MTAPTPLSEEELHSSPPGPPGPWRDEYVQRLFATLRHERGLREAAEKLVYVPGQWRCAKCNYVGMHMIFSATTGDVGVKAAAKTEKCPNGCGPLWPVTERQAGNELCDRMDAIVDERNAAIARATTAESSLAHEKRLSDELKRLLGFRDVKLDEFEKDIDQLESSLAEAKLERDRLSGLIDITAMERDEALAKVAVMVEALRIAKAALMLAGKEFGENHQITRHNDALSAAERIDRAMPDIPAAAQALLANQRSPGTVEHCAQCGYPIRHDKVCRYPEGSTHAPGELFKTCPIRRAKETQ